MAQGRVFGHIEGIPVFTVFPNRDALRRSGVHAQRQAGIHGDPNPDGGAFSICLAAGYEDNDDRGDWITYVGSGGQDRSGTQIANQSFDFPPNKALQISCDTKRPVRVVRGRSETNYYSPAKGYRYDGLYVVDQAEMRVGKKGFEMCTFVLRRFQEEGVPGIPWRRLLTTKKMLRMERDARR